MQALLVARKLIGHDSRRAINIDWLSGLLGRNLEFCFATSTGHRISLSAVHSTVHLDEGQLPACILVSTVERAAKCASSSHGIHGKATSKADEGLGLRCAEFALHLIPREVSHLDLLSSVQDSIDSIQEPLLVVLVTQIDESVVHFLGHDRVQIHGCLIGWAHSFG